MLSLHLSISLTLTQVFWIYLSINSPIHPSISLYLLLTQVSWIYLSPSLSIYNSPINYLSLHLPISLSLNHSSSGLLLISFIRSCCARIYLSIYPSIHLSLSISISIYLSIYLSPSPSPFLFYLYLTQISRIESTFDFLHTIMLCTIFCDFL